MTWDRRGSIRQHRDQSVAARQHDQDRVGRRNAATEHISDGARARAWRTVDTDALGRRTASTEVACAATSNFYVKP